MTLIERNGLKQDPEKWRATQRKAAEKQIAKARARVVVRQEGNRTTIRRSPLKPRSVKRAAQMREYVPLMLAYLEANPLCARCGKQSATELHHMAGRRGSALLDESRWIGLCGNCHRWATEHPEQAVEQGVSLLRVGVA